ncbi:GNAT family N-acetyltransferase [Pedobacter sp. FW305-3-2-15-E-R2A2]|jgi:ribosomal protein S18 acetylase RimI-like enzyme|uniref:GNAT family N-acetyltransferase n=1 Tax=Pedobacter sp. FW305-3-2-15-E-R2A2 TaxID=3140251 RepID=UPI0031403CB5
MEYIKISKASIREIETIQQIGKETFFETFAASNTAADMKKYLDENFNQEKLSAEIEQPDSQFYIAWEDQRAIGYLKVNTGQAQTELQEESSLEIERIYVLSAYHGKKVGQLLYEKAQEVAGLLKKSSIWLGVWEENPRAIKFYTRNGFVPFGQHLFKMGEDEQTDIMMRKRL